MDELEAKVRCLELAAHLNQRSGDHSVEGVVNNASILYRFTIASPQEETPAVELVDKPKRGRPPKGADPFS